MTAKKRVRLFLSAFVLLALCLACGANFGPRAQVNCQGDGNAYNCTVTHTSGGSGEICWDIEATCANGTSMVANSCVQLDQGATVTHRVPLSQFSNAQACDNVSTLRIVDRTAN